MKLNEPYKKDLDEETWLNLRKQFITATEASALMGVNPYTSANKLLKDKGTPVVKLVSEYLDRGLENEESVLKVAEEWLGGKLVESQGFYANPETRVSATPDGILDDGRMIEVKCTGHRNISKWSKYPPLYYIMQCQVQMYVTGAKENYIMARFFYNWPHKNCEAGADRMYKIKYSEEIMQICIDKVAKFWYAFESGDKIQVRKAEKEKHAQLLEATCTPVRGSIIMEKFEIDRVQLHIIRQTCLKAATKMSPGLPNDAALELAQLIEEKVFIDIAKEVDDNSRNFLIALGASVNAYVEGHTDKANDIHELRAFVVGGLKYILRG